MNYIDKNEYIWDVDKTIYDSETDILNIKDNNIYLTKNNIVYIFYIKIYKIPYSDKDFDQFTTRNELLLSLYLKIYKNLYNKCLPMNIYDKSEKCCEFCFNMSKNILSIKTNKFNDIMICKNCSINTKEENYYINNRLFKSTNSINIEIVKRVKNDLIYFYSIQQHYNDFCYIKLISTRWYQILNTKLCQLCYKNDKCYLLECQECHQFSLKQYSMIYMKLKYFDLFNYLHVDVINIILKYYMILIEFDGSDFLYYYNKINKKDDINLLNANTDNKTTNIDNLIKNDCVIDSDDDIFYPYTTDRSSTTDALLDFYLYRCMVCVVSLIRS